MSLGDSGGFLFSLDSSNQDQLFLYQQDKDNNNSSNNVTIINNIQNNNTNNNDSNNQQQLSISGDSNSNVIEANGELTNDGTTIIINNNSDIINNIDSQTLTMTIDNNHLHPHHLSGSNNEIVLTTTTASNGIVLNESTGSTNNSTAPPTPSNTTTTTTSTSPSLFQPQQNSFYVPPPPPPPPPVLVPHYQTLQQPSVIYTQLLQQQQKKLRPVTERSQDDKKKEALNFLNFYFRVSPNKKSPTIARSTVLALYTSKITIDKRYKQPNDMANLCGAVYTFIFQNLEDETIKEYITSAENERLSNKNDVKKRKRKKNHDISNGVLNNHDSFLTCIKYATLLPYLEFVHSSELSAQHYGIDFKYNHPDWNYSQEDLLRWENDLKDQKQGSKKINSVDDNEYANNLNTQLAQNNSALMSSLNNSTNGTNSNNSSNNNGTPSLSSSGSNFKNIDLEGFEILSQNNAFSNSILNNSNNTTTTTTTTSSSSSSQCNTSQFNSTPFASSTGTHSKKGAHVNYFKMNSIPVNVIENNEHFIIYAFIPFYKPNALKIIVNQMDIILEGVISLPDTIQIPNGSEIYVPTSFVNCKQMDIQEGHFSKVIRLASPIAGSIVGKRDGVVVIICKKEDKASTVHHL
ncbi:hypothetical protein DICPUDRAFT_97073 [Dictyostelium purpureum]|uniref:Uncharacterized protein n=1 Tax=Dictyostelium purpureum TaxID=5786 RepID=F0ZDN6_DICPU|nr:uncharacterized protein DICPUDRAFT_97073 [Dictyostelium purpureum]EGC37947.1 hypothetical protein DICPUDRAFT_97073 [Dictyostelium purpureum]|eukprot:XP_003285518.1 hypothetical protein DICPUDRAFT_97073 [Dictyostelium purpureum]